VKHPAGRTSPPPRGLLPPPPQDRLLRRANHPLVAATKAFDCNTALEEKYSVERLKRLVPPTVGIPGERNSSILFFKPLNPPDAGGWGGVVRPSNDEGLAFFQNRLTKDPAINLHVGGPVAA